MQIESSTAEQSGLACPKCAELHRSAVFANRLKGAVTLSLVTLSATVLAPTGAQAACQFLMPLGGNGSGPEPWIVKKKVERPKGLIGKAVGRTNWNTDFVVSQPYRS